MRSSFSYKNGRRAPELIFSMLGREAATKFFFVLCCELFMNSETFFPREILDHLIAIRSSFWIWPLAFRLSHGHFSKKVIQVFSFYQDVGPESGPSSQLIDMCRLYTCFYHFLPTRSVYNLTTDLEILICTQLICRLLCMLNKLLKDVQKCRCHWVLITKDYLPRHHSNYSWESK